MCRGCNIKSNGKSCTYAYLNWLDDYQKIIHDMKALNKKIHVFEKEIDQQYKKPVSAFRRELIRCRKQYAKADTILNRVYNKKINQTPNK